jgi:Sec-independent protein secretion pathway component TatC
VSIKPRRRVLVHNEDRRIIHVGLFIICAMLSAMGMGASALWCYLPVAALLELLALVAPLQHSRRM